MRGEGKPKKCSQQSALAKRTIQKNGAKERCKGMVYSPPAKKPILPSPILPSPILPSPILFFVLQRTITCVKFFSSHAMFFPQRKTPALVIHT